jgi:choice-of-anchor A domain-containing protein
VLTRSVFGVIVLLSLSLVHPETAEANPFGIAGEYNVFVFGDIIQIGTDVEGRVAGGGNVTYGANGPSEGFYIASNTPAGGAAELVAGGDVTLTNGTVGGSGTVVYGGTASIAGNVGYGLAMNGSVIDFAAEQSYLTNLSSFWGGLAVNGTSDVLGNGNIELTGADADLNVFTLNAGDITSGISFNFFTPQDSTILVNIDGLQGDLQNFGFFFNSIAAEPHLLVGNPFQHVLFNFLNAVDINIDQIAVAGSILAPFAHIDFGLNSHIDGHLIAASLEGSGESHDYPFDDIAPVPVPEPATLVLLISGLAGMAAWRQRRRT